MQKNIFSEHLFLFPFAWQIPAKTIAFPGILDKLSNWELAYTSLEENKAYNEYVYFYKSVRSALYTYPDMPIVVRNYHYKDISKEASFQMRVNQKEYTLSIVKISLKLYKTGIGILGIYLENDCYEEEEAIININHFNKCIYPHVLPIEKAKKDSFPEYVKLWLNEVTIIEEYFEENYKMVPIPICTMIMGLLGEPFSLLTSKSTYLTIEPILGSQMFVLCLYQCEKIVTAMKESTIKANFLEELICLNTNIKCHSDYPTDSFLTIDYIKNKDTIYGTSRFSLMAISRELVDIKIYDQLVHLVLMQRASLLRFSNELACVSTLEKNQLVPAIQNIYEIYIQFINQLYFKEVTEEIQGSRIYDSLSKQLRIEEELKQLGFEMEEMQEYATLIEQSASKFKMNMISMIGAALIIPTFSTGFFGMNILQKDWYDWWNHKEVILWMNAYVWVPMLVVVGIYTWRREKTRRNRIQKLILLITIIGAICIVTKYGTGITVP